MAGRCKSILGSGAGAMLLASAALAQQQPPAPVVPPPPPPPAAAAAPLKVTIPGYKPVSAESLVKPADGDWPMYRRTYNGWGYSPLKEINTQNVKNLVPAWTMATGFNEGHEAPPIVVNGTMFVATAGNQVLAIDAASGDLLWRYTRQLPADMLGSHPTNRGVGVLGDKVYWISRDGVLVALNARSGAEVWTAKVQDYKHGYYANLAPLIAEGKVLVGSSGGEYGIRGYVVAYDAEKGKEVWRTFMVPEPGQPGSETWPKNDAWKTGGASTWITGQYDPDTKLVYWGTGNGGPWMGDQRPGDNLYVTSVVALNVADGAIKGHFQYHQNDSWDWDEVAAPILVDVERDGRQVKGLVHAARSGVLWQLERTPDGPIKFVSGKPYVFTNWIKSMDPKTGRIEPAAGTKPGTGIAGDHCPSFWGGKDWPPIAYSPDTRLAYIPANENLCSIIVGAVEDYVPGRRYVGRQSLELYKRQGTDDHIGEVQAWDLKKGEMVWKREFKNSQNWGPLLATAGGLVFGGGTNDRMFRAFDAKTGAVLWEQKLNSGVIGVPVSFAANGKQYISVQAGWGIDAAGMQTRLSQKLPAFNADVPTGGVIWTFAVKE